MKRPASPEAGRFSVVPGPAIVPSARSPMRKLFTLLWLALLLPCAACARQPLAGPATIAVQPLDSAKAPLPERLGHLRLEGAWSLRGPAATFGGISAARWDGERLLLLGDRSRLFELAWPPHAPGRPFAARVLEEQALADRHGQPLDAEAMVLLPDGTRLVGDEGAERLLRFPPGQGRAARGPAPRLVDLATAAPMNEGVEALTRLPDGGLLAIREGEGDDGLHPAVRMSGESAQPLRYRAADGFRPTDADVAGAHLFVLERRVSLFGGWQARITATPLAALPREPGGIVAGQELARLAGPELGENYEALAVRQDAGAYRFLVVADDNFSPLQRTLLLELSWSPAAGETGTPAASSR
jgi:hypothetical protein